MANIGGAPVMEHETRAATEKLLLLGLMKHQTRKIVARLPNFQQMFEFLSTVPVSTSIVEFDLTHVSVLRFSNLLYFMKNNCNSDNPADPPPLFSDLNMEEFRCFDIATPAINESLFQFYQKIGFTAIDISVMKMEHGVSKDKDLLRFLVAAAGQSPAGLTPAMYRLRWAMNHAQLQLHDPTGELRDTPMQNRDLCGDFDFQRAAGVEATKFFECLGFSYCQNTIITTLPVLAGERDCNYDRMVTVALDLERTVLAEEEPETQMDGPIGSPFRTRSVDWPAFLDVNDTSLTSLTVQQPGKEPKAEEQRSKVIQDLGRGARASVYKHVCFMETRMRDIFPHPYRFVCFDHALYKEWAATIDWDKAKTYLPRRRRTLTRAPPFHVNGKLTYLDGTTESIPIRERLCVDEPWSLEVGSPAV